MPHCSKVKVVNDKSYRDRASPSDASIQIGSKADSGDHLLTHTIGPGSQHTLYCVTVICSALYCATAIVSQFRLALSLLSNCYLQTQ